ncbi:hypothetical protein BH11ACT7_BH11ACT7_36070 [soil metagenome]
MMPQHNLAKADEVAAYLGTSTNQLNRLRYEGHGPQFVKLGHSVRYRWEDVHNWVNGNLRTSSAGTR